MIARTGAAMFEKKFTQPNRLSPRRHDVGAALMLKFRHGPDGKRRDRKLRTIDALHALMLTLICFTVAAAPGSQAERPWSLAPVESVSPAATGANRSSIDLATRTAPDAPTQALRAPSVRLSLIDDEPAGRVKSIPARLSRDVRVAEEEPVSEAPSSPATHQPLRAALHLGDQLRSSYR
ncbi:hypothetical protein [Caulifigura coniformis]|uniref:hypothetical protein n=1 Tax=Caulifigura coniformis TaxID=2527983 RepID=UPI0011A94233|nr:hypothetical protein [Caulifigura coniformis]